MAALYWAFQDLGDPAQTAAARIEAIATAKCNGCQTRPAPGLLVTHASIPHAWYGQQLCAGAVPVADAVALRAYADQGDVILVGAPQYPMHSMVVVNAPGPGQPVNIRGFNNFATLGTGVHLQYDNADRDISVANYWHAGPPLHFGQAHSTGGPPFRVQFDTFMNNATAVRGRFAPRHGGLVYTGN
jgi:hypothetical protein